MFLGHSYESWILFHVVIILLLVLDLGVFNRKTHVIKVREAALWTLFWVSIGLSFGAYVGWRDGHEAAVQYFTGFLVEKSLSVDNLFVFLVLFQAFKIEKQYRHRLLYWGVVGAIILRATMIAAGTVLLAKFHWLIYIFGAFLIYTGFKIFRGGTEELDPKSTRMYRVLSNLLPFSDKPYHGKFLPVDEKTGKRELSIGFLVLLLVEASDVMFALDSVPAVFGITRDPFIVYTSNIFAILGLRSLYFVLEDTMDKFHLLKYGLGIILALVGTKMIMEPYYHVTPFQSLGVIFTILIVSILLSLKIKKKH